MAQVSKYRYLLNQYPETVQKEQFRIICHISKRTARYLLQSGLVPCVQSGKKTRNYTIKMKDIVRYLERREIHPEKYKLPPGSYSGTYLARDKNGQLRNWGQLTAAKWMKAYTEKGYACAVHVPHLNDFNTDLVEMRKGRSVEDLDRQRMAELETAFEQSAEEEPEQGMEV